MCNIKMKIQVVAGFLLEAGSQVHVPPPVYFEQSTRVFNPLTPRAFCQKCNFLDVLEIFSLDMSQISSNLLKRHLQHGSMPSFHWYHISQHLCLGMHRNQNLDILFLDEKVTYRFFSFFLLHFLFLLFLSFCASD